MCKWILSVLNKCFSMLENCLYFCQDLKLILNTVVIQMANGSAKPENIGFKKRMQGGERIKRAFGILDTVNFPKTPYFMR